jgi:hypothetical protein
VPKDGFVPRLVLVTLAAILVTLVWRGVPLLEEAMPSPEGSQESSFPVAIWPRTSRRPFLSLKSQGQRGLSGPGTLPTAVQYPAMQRRKTRPGGGAQRHGARLTYSWRVLWRFGPWGQNDAMSLQDFGCRFRAVLLASR